MIPEPTSNAIFRELRKIIDIPEQCVAMTINLVAFEPALITCETTVEQCGKIEHVERKYILTQLAKTPEPT